MTETPTTPQHSHLQAAFVDLLLDDFGIPIAVTLLSDLKEARPLHELVVVLTVLPIIPH